MRKAVPILLACLVATPLAADDVFLKNGRTFEDVVAEIRDDQVHIRLAFGEMAFPVDAIERIERSESSLIAFESQRAELRSNPSSDAADWVELARSAARRGNRHGAREAALVASAMDPHVPGLEPLMRDMDYVFEPELVRWIPFAESMRRRGYALVDGQWLSAEQLLARSRAVAEAARARDAEQESRLTRAVLAMAAAQLAREPEPQTVEPNPNWAWPVMVYPQPFKWRYPNPFKGTHRATPYRGGSDHTAIPIERRQPGSLFPIAPKQPVAPPAAHQGGMVRPNGSR